jgi:hypothetical protein
MEWMADSGRYRSRRAPCGASSPFSMFALPGTEECLRQSTPVFAQMRNCRYAARWVVMIRDSSRSVVPREISERISRSKETDGSPASILATRDWLD